MTDSGPGRVAALLWLAIACGAAAETDARFHGGPYDGWDSATSSSTRLDAGTDPSNAAPTVDAGADQTVWLPLASAALAAAVGDDGRPDPAGAPTVAWTTASGPGAVAFSSPNAASTTATFGAIGIYVLRATASDGELSAIDHVQVTVRPAHPDLGFEQPAVRDYDAVTPTFESPWTFLAGSGVSGNTSGYTNANPPTSEGRQVAFVQMTGEFYQPIPGFVPGQDYRLTFAAAQRASLASAQDFAVLVDGAVVGTFRPTGTAYERLQTTSFRATAATVEVRFRGLDSSGGDNTALIDDLQIELASSAGGDTGVNAAPSVDAGADQTITLPITDVQLSGSASDDGRPDPPAALSVTWSVASGPGAVAFADAHSASTTATFADAGVYVLRLAASDGALSAVDQMQVTVQAALTANQAPVVDAGTDQTIAPGDVALLAGSAIDDGLPNPPGALTLEWTVVSGPAAVIFADPHAAHTSATFTTSGSYVLRLTAADGASTASDDVAVTQTTDAADAAAPDRPGVDVGHRSCGRGSGFALAVAVFTCVLQHAAGSRATGRPRARGRA